MTAAPEDLCGCLEPLSSVMAWQLEHDDCGSYALGKCCVVWCCPEALSLIDIMSSMVCTLMNMQDSSFPLLCLTACFVFFMPVTQSLSD